MVGVISLAGGQYSGEMKVKETSHLIINEPKGKSEHTSYRIRSNYRTYPYKRTVKKFRSLQITASVLFLYFFIKAYVVDTHLNCIDFK